MTIKDHYSTLACSDEIITLTKCAFSNLTNSQWLEADLLWNPLPGQTVTSQGYVINYAGYATGWITPEYGFWKMMNGLTALAGDAYKEAIFDTYQMFNTSGIFNGVIF